MDIQVLLQTILKAPIRAVEPLSGGDISQVYKVSMADQIVVVKLQNGSVGKAMLEAESAGLRLIADQGVIATPGLSHSGTIGDTSYLVMDYISQTRLRRKVHWDALGVHLANLHKKTAPQFGLDEHNFIGSLNQDNTWTDTMGEFYIHYRLEPQIAMAHDKGYRLGHLEIALRNIEDAIPVEPPSLIHGDLWSGNVLYSEDSVYLIDPAVCYGHREMDLAMMQLFGGFDIRVVEAYTDAFPLQSDWEARVELWQLYYLLVHLNIFGRGYLSQVVQIFDQYR